MLNAIVQKHVWDQLFTVDTIWNIGETGDIYTTMFFNLNYLSPRLVCHQSQLKTWECFDYFWHFPQISQSHFTSASCVNLEWNINKSFSNLAGHSGRINWGVSGSRETGHDRLHGQVFTNRVRKFHQGRNFSLFTCGTQVL